MLRGSGPLTSWLVATGSLDIRVAVRDSGRGTHIYHEKLGLFGDEEENWVAFSGSANESLSGLEGNFESVDVYRSWVPAERKRLDQKLAAFDRLWTNDTDGVEVLTFADAARRGFLRARVEEPVQSDGVRGPTEEASPSSINVGPVSGVEEVLYLPGDIQLREHQKSATRQWFQARGRGILAMATGSGKTITALAIATKVYEWASAPLLIVIVCPYLHLCAQWLDEARRFGLDPLLCALDRRTWFESLSMRLYNLASGTRRIASVVVSNATLATPAFQALLHRAPPRALFIGDEVHNLGAPDLRTALPENIGLRLGLSLRRDATATPPAPRPFSPTSASRSSATPCGRRSSTQCSASTATSLCLFPSTMTNWRCTLR